MPPEIRRFVRSGEGPSDETKRRILEATRAQLKSEPFARFSLEAIARRAGLTRLTVYYQFGSKRGLLEALYNNLAETGGLMRLPGLYRLDDPAVALMELIAIFCDFWASDRELIRSLRSLAVLDPEFQPAVERDRWRREGIGGLVQRLDTAGRLTIETPRQDLADLLSTVTSFETFDALAGGGRSNDEVKRLVRALAQEILGWPTED
jgi:AcrR family transcriptional regulator